METVVSKRGQTVVPSSIRKRYHIHEGDRLVWVDDGRSIKVIPVEADAVKAFRGRGREETLGGTLKKLRSQSDSNGK